MICKGMNMVKFRKWFFKLLTGYDLIDYEEIVNDFHRSVKLSERLLQEGENVLREASEVNELSRKIIDNYGLGNTNIDK